MILTDEYRTWVAQSLLVAHLSAGGNPNIETMVVLAEDLFERHLDDPDSPRITPEEFKRLSEAVFQHCASLTRRGFDVVCSN